MPVRASIKRKPRVFKRRKRTKQPTSAKAIAKTALKLARANASSVETKVSLRSGATAAYNFVTGGPTATNLTDLAIGTGEGQFVGNHMSLSSLRLKYRLQNARAGCPDNVRVMLVQYGAETVCQTNPTIPLDTANLPGALHAGVDYCLAPYKRFTEDPANAAYTLRYTVLYDKCHRLATIDDTSGSIVDVDTVLRFKGKSANYSRDVGTLLSTSHEKNGLWLYFLGSDVNRAAGVCSVDVKWITQLRYKDA